MGRTALVLGLIVIICSVLQLSRATGGPGTGNGVVGSGVAIVLGLIGIFLGARALTRYRRMDTGSTTVTTRERT
jgi:hypothetical protein